MTNQVWYIVKDEAVVFLFPVASQDQTDHTKQLEYNYPWLDDEVEPFISNYDMLGEMCDLLVM